MTAALKEARLKTVLAALIVLGMTSPSIIWACKAVRSPGCWHKAQATDGDPRAAVSTAFQIETSL